MDTVSEPGEDVRRSEGGAIALLRYAGGDW